jgi:hypothetical protein
VDPICKIFRKHHMLCNEIGIVDDDKGRGEVCAFLQGKERVLAH